MAVTPVQQRLLGITNPIVVRLGAKTLVAGTGTVTTTIGTKNVTGSGTKFLSELRVGDALAVAGDTPSPNVILTITSDTALTVTTNWVTGVIGAAYSVNNTLARIIYTGQVKVCKILVAGLTTGVATLHLYNGQSAVQKTTNFIDGAELMWSYFAPASTNVSDEFWPEKVCEKGLYLDQSAIDWAGESVLLVYLD